MIKRINEKMINFALANNPFTNVYGLARSMMAFSTFLLFLFNKTEWLFRPAQGLSEIDMSQNLVQKISFFNLFPNHLEVARWIIVILMLIVMSGWRPRITGIIHFWIAFSVFNSAILLDGGEQVLTVMTLILLPITLLDDRKWHWSMPETRAGSAAYLYKVMGAHVFITFARLQLSILYGQAAIERLKNPEWLDGTAVYYFFQIPMLGITETMKSLLNPILTSPFVFFITWGVTIVELFLAFGFLAPKNRWKYFLASGVFLHLGIAVLLGLWTFSLTMIACLIVSYVPEEKMLGLKWLSKWFNRKDVYTELQNNPAL
ncbi:sporulation-delaying protein SdpB family protein [Thermicanus aegyptius]|uniref:sporulation-delaying protein SdpB family protein n=1 Tax=Thermicanus aegyptius TaxID=94009 RepID=UPI00048F3504|nr:sporulation-delaying protein SdpB family protein [Thermicanus aegyptius]